jgi:fatty-acyl-CoA synthase
MQLPAFAFEPLSPISFLRRSGAVFNHRLAVVDGDISFTYGELLDRCQRLAGALRARGLAPGDRVAVLMPNSHQMLEAHHGPAMAGLVLVPLNTRLAVAEHAAIIDASGASLLLADDALLDHARAAAAAAARDVTVVDMATYEADLRSAAPLDEPVTDELALLSLNYTSGTTGTPKGVMYHHRGAYLQAMAMIIHAKLDASSRYLWTLPMFHCHGWMFPWSVTAAGGVHVCLRSLDPAEIWLQLDDGVTHLCAAPTVLTMMATSPDAHMLGTPVHAITGGAPPTPAMLQELGAFGIDVHHSYGLTESFGPAMLCEWHPEWDALPAAAQADLMARQGVGSLGGTQVRVIGNDGLDVEADATTSGEIVLRGNAVMSGYFDAPHATAAATTDDGWFRTGDVAVMHADGYVEITDRAKDVIISGGENISSVEVERVLVRHPAVLEAAVVGAHDELWGERPVAFVTLRDGTAVTSDELQAHVRAQLARFKAPDTITFGPLPKTSTGKVQKHVLRSRL